MITLFKRHFLASVFTIIFSNGVSAEYSLYDGDHGTLSAGLEVQQAIFSEINNQSGSPAKAHLSDVYWEMSVKPNLDATLNLPGDSKLYGGFSYIYSSTLGHDPSGYTQKGVEMYLQETDYTTLGRYHDYRYGNTVEDLFLGWQSGKLFDEEEKITVDLSGGRQNYKLGSGFLLYYGADNGGNLGTGWINPRTAFDNTLLSRFNFNEIKLEGFYLETRPLNPAEKRSYQGANLEYHYSDTATFGVSYIKTVNKHFLHEDGSTTLLGRQVLDNDTYNARADFSPLENFTISTEYAYQINTTKTNTSESADKSRIHASGGFGQIEYKRDDLFWQPAISYRYAIQEAGFDSMSPGFGTWSTWFQGEINGEWILYNSNLITHVGRLVLTPEESVTLNLIYLNYTFVNPSAYGVSSANYGNEINLLTDWAYNDSLDISLGLEAFIPSEAGKEYLAGGNQVWFQGMLAASYAF